jgi:dipeptidyl-peptidase-4
MVGKTLERLSANGGQQLATFSPDNRNVAFVRDNNLFIKDLETGGEYGVTADGEYNHIINGAPDWVYEEEFELKQAYAWSPDGKRLAYYRFDEEHVRLFNMTSYGGLYPEWYQFKYPKAGEQNSYVTLHVYDLSERRTTDIGTGEEKDQYIPRIEWTTDPLKLSFLRLNRLQNKLELLVADARNGQSECILTEEETEYIAQPDDNKLTFLEDDKHFLFMSEKDGYRHLYLYDMNGNLINPVTQGRWDVNELLGYDPAHGRVYYSSCEESSINQDVYRISINGSNKKKLSKDKGWNTAVFSMGFRYFIHYHSNAATPRIVTLHQADGRQLKVLLDNRLMTGYATTIGLGTKEFLTISAADGTAMNACMIKPVDFDPDREYPLFMFVYGGPESQEVKDEWDYEQWFYQLVPMGYIVACVDNRGTGGRGEAFRKCTYLRLGELETADQITAARYLGELPYVDEKRIGIFGWSYGGYLASLCMTRGNGIFKAGIAVAPVTNWKYYDSIYTERYMRTPGENGKNYTDNSPLNHAQGLHGKFLLVHGMSDDNVHLQNSVDFAHALIEADKLFEMMFYPGQNHGISGGNSRNHLYQKMFDFILTNL